jgi:hypothetical protein
VLRDRVAAHGFVGEAVILSEDSGCLDHRSHRTRPDRGRVRSLGVRRGSGRSLLTAGSRLSDGQQGGEEFPRHLTPQKPIAVPGEHRPSHREASIDSPTYRWNSMPRVICSIGRCWEGTEKARNSGGHGGFSGATGPRPPITAPSDTDFPPPATA